MKKIHKSNWIIMTICIVILTLLAITRYGIGRELIMAMVCLYVCETIVTIIYKKKKTIIQKL